MMKRTIVAATALGLIGLAVAVGAWSGTDDNALADSVAAEEKARIAALEHADVAALERILADDLTYVHASGKTDNKASFLVAIRSGELHYVSWQSKAMHVRVLGGTAAAIDGEYLVRVTDRRVKPDPFDVNIFFLGVYVKRDGRWKMVAWQSTRDVALSPLN
jgi:hypothetical protein